jgi:glutamate--cysteine ligase regulatory subunit
VASSVTSAGGRRWRCLLISATVLIACFFSCSNIISGGPSIIRKPGAFRSNTELVNSLRSNLFDAQEASADEAIANGNGNGISNGNGIANHSPDDLSKPTRRPPVSSWTSQDGSTLYIPSIDWSLSGLQEEPSRYEITVKLFFLATGSVASRPQHTADAIDLVLRELVAPSIDLLIVSFPGMSFDGDCEYEADKQNARQGNDAEEARTWPVVEDLQRRGLVKHLGIAEFGSEKLACLLKKVEIRPTVDQINIKNCCNVPPPLIKLAKQEKIELLVHTDCTDILPKGTLRELLGSGPRGAGILADPTNKEAGGLKGDLMPQWVVKYTAVVRDRGVIENKGYFAGAELIDE